MTQRLPLIIFAAVMAAIPFIPGVPPFWIVLLDNIGLAASAASRRLGKPRSAASAPTPRRC
jgi:hypothetical protein